jgi:hypothetical protein
VDLAEALQAIDEGRLQDPTSASMMA